jgi:hypothetical protein
MSENETPETLLDEVKETPEPKQVVETKPDPVQKAPEPVEEPVEEIFEEPELDLKAELDIVIKKVGLEDQYDNRTPLMNVLLGLKKRPKPNFTQVQFYLMSLEAPSYVFDHFILLIEKTFNLKPYR